VRRALLCACIAAACERTPDSPGPVSPTITPTQDPARVPDGAQTIAAPVVSSGRCDASHDAALRLIPDDANIVSGANVAALLQAPVLAPVLTMPDLGNLKPLAIAAGECGIGRDAWRSVTFGATFAGGNSSVALRADGLGTLDKLECIRTRVKNDAVADKFTITTAPSGIELAFDDGSRGWVIDPCTLFVATKSWVEPVTARRQGLGNAAVDGRLVSAIGRADPRKHAWIAVAIDSATMGTAIPGAQDLAISFDVTDRIKLAASLAFPDPATAAKQSTELEKQFTSIKGMFGSMGMPQSLVDSVKIGPAGSFVMISAEVDDRAVAALVKMTK
jgi:hypothetical protein